jgi:uncharacterized protein YndB with AHSA1/START domain
MRPGGYRLLGILAPNLVAVALMALTSYLVTGTVFQTLHGIVAQFVVIPVLMGFVSVYFLRKVSPQGERPFEIPDILPYLGFSLVNTGTALFIAFLLGEGNICLVVVAPLVLTSIFVGCVLGKTALASSSRLRLTLVPLLLAVMVGDSLVPRHHRKGVTDTLLIHAPPHEVWRYVVEVPPIPPRSGYWLHRLGLPRPLRTTATGHFAGARRDCIFEGNMVFVERIAELEPGKKITFDVLQQPPHPEIMGHLDITRGQMILRDNGNGTTTLIGTTWYSLHVYPAWYFERWADNIGRNVHWSVMGQIKTLAERGRP